MMHKNKGKQQQLRGHKRRKKVLTRRKNKNEHKDYLVKLMFKYRENLKLKDRPEVGAKYLENYLNDEPNSDA